MTDRPTRLAGYYRKLSDDAGAGFLLAEITAAITLLGDSRCYDMNVVRALNVLMLARDAAHKPKPC